MTEIRPTCRDMAAGLDVQFRQLETWNSSLMHRKGQCEQIETNLAEEERSLSVATRTQELSKQGKLFLQQEALERRQEAVDAIQAMTSTALGQAYGPDYRLTFDTHEDKREAGSSNYTMTILVGSDCEGGELLTELEESRGGGITDAVAFALRIGALDFMGYEGPMIMDEAYKQISNDDKLDVIARFLYDYSRQTGRQFIFATHKADVFGEYADRVIHITKTDGVAQARLVQTGAFESCEVDGDIPDYDTSSDYDTISDEEED